jgi:hypothetical protein
MATTTGGQATGGVSPCPGLPYDSSISLGGFCTGMGASGEPVKVDLYILLDRSQSMGTATRNGQSSRWLDATAAIEQFVADPRVLARDVRVGIQFFGLTGGIDDAQACNASNYATPAVGIGSLPSVGPQIAAAIGAVTPSGEAPSVPALQGGIRYASQWQAQNSSRLTILALLTDGWPTACVDQSDASWLAVAEAGMALDPPIRTYVFGLGMGADAYRLNALAQSGGTGQATLIEDGNLPGGLAAALAQTVTNPSLTSNQLPCEFQIPSPPTPLEAISYDRTMVVHTPINSGPEEVPYAASLAGCSPAYGGWYYDVVPYSDPKLPDPSKLIMCPCTCASFNGGTVDIYFGCHPVMTGQ